MGKKSGNKSGGKAVAKAVTSASSPAEAVRLLIGKGKVKKKCCRSKSRCKKCPLTALKQVKAEFAKAA
ncbi:hypothetical protein [Actinokineospora bangkokensis]|uniref:Uncharacterized protein n=1 Tax=Actinokineospora bangkokensis TaxID=1193682 RepID=A0A1Q9LDK1_9PSEU|nr:hypothetical protein [Actinokineospora bangkokensis]OLR90084.1 hypothetical protein BJP25_03660 [Actinokineospora bangkokensis]